MAKRTAEETFSLPPGTAARLLAWLFAGLALATAVLVALPNRDYYRWQQGDGTILFRARWVYERIHYDPTPIDVAMMGSSRMEASIRVGELSELLSRRLGRPIHVVNFGLPQEGRDLHWTVAREVLENRPEVKLVVLTAGAEVLLSHPGFRFIGEDAGIATAPLIYNPYFAENLLTIPYRHLAYFIQGLWPSAFQLSPEFDPAIHKARGFDPADSFISATGNLIDRNKVLDPAAAAEQSAMLEVTKGVSPSGFLPPDQRYSIERSYTRRIGRLAEQKGVRVAFLRVPIYRSEERFEDPQFYRAIGPVLEATMLGNDAGDYMDPGHLNRSGTAKLTPWLADRLAPLLSETAPN